MLAVYMPKPESLNAWQWNSYSTEGAPEPVGKGEVKALTPEEAKAEVAAASGADHVFLFAVGS